MHALILSTLDVALLSTVRPVAIAETRICVALHADLCPPFVQCSRWHIGEQYTTALHPPHRFVPLFPHRLAHWTVTSSPPLPKSLVGVDPSCGILHGRFEHSTRVMNVRDRVMEWLWKEGTFVHMHGA